jgi:hypothetical protein
MKVSELKVGVNLAWWVRPYLFGLVAACWLVGKEPDMSKVQYWLKRGIRMRVNP